MTAMLVLVALTAFTMEEKRLRVSFHIPAKPENEKKPPVRSQSVGNDRKELNTLDEFTWEDFQQELKKNDSEKYKGTVLEFILDNCSEDIKKWMQGYQWAYIDPNKLLRKMKEIKHLFKGINLDIEKKKKIISRFLTGKFMHIFNEKEFKQELKNFLLSPLYLKPSK